MASMLMMAMWQDDVVSHSDAKLLMIFISLVTVALVAQAIVVVVAAAGAMRMQKKMTAIADELSVVALPFLREAHGLFRRSNSLIEEITPSLHAIRDNITKATENVAAASEVVKGRAQEFEATLSEANQRARIQMRRVDTMMTAALTTTEEIGSTIHRAVLVPVRELMGLINGVRAAVDSLTGRARTFSVFQGGRAKDDSPETRL